MIGCNATGFLKLDSGSCLNYKCGVVKTFSKEEELKNG